MYTITVRNNGFSTVNGATVTDNVSVKLTNVPVDLHGHGGRKLRRARRRRQH